MIALLTTLPGHTVHVDGTVRLRVRFVDERTDLDQIPAGATFMVTPPGAALLTYSWTGLVSPTLDTTLTGFTAPTAGPATLVFEAQIAVHTAGMWSFGWNALDGAGHQLVTAWGALDVEAPAAFAGGIAGGGSQGPSGPPGPAGTSGGSTSSGLRYACPIGTSVGQLVALVGANAVDLADASNPARRPALGFVSSIGAGGARCDIAYSGEQALFSGLAPGGVYRISTTPGAISTAVPAGSDVEDQVVGYALDTTTLLVSIDPTLFVTP